MGFSRLFDCMLCGSKRRPSIEGKNPVYEDTYSAKRVKITVKDSQDSFETDSYRTKVSSPIPSRTDLVEKIPAPRINRALIVAAKKRYDIVDEAFPLYGEDEIVISTKAVGLNPIDWKSVDYNFCLPSFPWITGREMAGIVEEVGTNVSEFKVGDRVWTSTYYRDRRAGCFQHYVTVPKHTVTAIPSNLTFEQASTLGVAGLTSAMALWKWLQVPLPTGTIPPAPSTTQAEYILIWGGSAVTGQFAIQLAALSNLKTITVTSARMSSNASNLGAHHVVIRDNKTNEEIVTEIRSIAGDNITRAIDLVGTTTAPFCLQAMSMTKRGLFAPLAMMNSSTIVPENIKVETVEMKKFVLEEESVVYSRLMNGLVEQGRIVLPGIEVLDGGLDVIIEGLEAVKRGDMGGKRVVVKF